MAQLREKYPLGSCSVHPDKHCVRHHLIPKYHFDLGMDMQAYAWAGLIVSGLPLTIFRSLKALNHSTSKLPIWTRYQVTQLLTLHMSSRMEEVDMLQPQLGGMERVF